MKNITRYILEGILDDEEEIMDAAAVTVGEKLGILLIGGQPWKVQDEALKISFNSVTSKLKGKYRLRKGSADSEACYKNFSLLMLDTPYIGWQQHMLMSLKHYLKPGWDVKITDQGIDKLCNVEHIMFVFSKGGVEKYYVTYGLDKDLIGSY